MLKPISLIAALSAASVPAASAAGQEALQCALVQDNAKRLACYDTVYAAQLPAQNPPKSPVDKAKTKQPVDLAASAKASIEKKQAAVVFEQPAETAVSEQAVKDAADAYTPLSKLYDLDQNDERGILSVREHNPMYLMPAWYNSSPNYRPQSPTRGVSDAEASARQKRLEAKMQVSFKTKLLEDLFKTRSDVWFGYTQESNWQLWSQGEKSAPFRNNDYSPEVFITQPVKANLPLGGKLRMVGAGFVHQSNGRTRPESRSWNRIYAMAGMEWGRLTVIPRVWMRAFDQKNDDDDNPDISRYMGYGDLKLQYNFNDKQVVSSTVRYNPKTGRGGVMADYSFPLRGKMKGYVQAFHGYGENLLDYNHKQNSIGFGVKLNDWDGL